MATQWSLAEVDACTSRWASVDLRTAARMLGIGRNRAYRLALTQGHLGSVPVERVGGIYYVPTAPIRTALGLRPVRLSPGRRQA